MYGSLGSSHFYITCINTGPLHYHLFQWANIQSKNDCSFTVAEMARYWSKLKLIHSLRERGRLPLAVNKVMNEWSYEWVCKAVSCLGNSVYRCVHANLHDLRQGSHLLLYFCLFILPFQGKICQ